MSATNRVSPIRRLATIQIAWSAVRTKGSRLRSFFYHLEAKRGPNKAIVATAAKILRIIYALLRDGVVYDERRAAEDLEQQEKRQGRQLAKLERQAKKLGYNLVPVAA